MVKHTPASISEIASVLTILCSISPLIGQNLKIDSSNIKKCPEIRKVLDNHTRGRSYFRQFFKRPLVAPCECIPCRKGMPAPMIMPLEAYAELHNNLAMSLPITKTSSGAAGTRVHLHYMSFEEAMTHPFTDEHQPSIQSRRHNNNNNTIIGGVALGERETSSLELEANKQTHTKQVSPWSGNMQGLHEAPLPLFLYCAK